MTANIYGPQQVNVVLTNKKGFQKGANSLSFCLLWLSCQCQSEEATWHHYLQVLLCLY